MTNTFDALFSELSIIEEDFNKLDKNEKKEKLENQLDKFIEELPKLYNKIYTMYQEETVKTEFLESIQKFKETNEIYGIIELFFRLNTISIYTMKKSMELVEEDRNFNDEPNEFDNETKKIFYNVLNNTEELQNLILFMKTYYPTYKSQTNILDKQVEETLIFWNTLYERINECESTLNDAYTSLVDTLVESVDTIISSVEARLS